MEYMYIYIFFDYILRFLSNLLYLSLNYDLYSNLYLLIKIFYLSIDKKSLLKDIKISSYVYNKKKYIFFHYKACDL